MADLNKSLKKMHKDHQRQFAAVAEAIDELQVDSDVTDSEDSTILTLGRQSVLIVMAEPSSNITV